MSLKKEGTPTSPTTGNGTIKKVQFQLPPGAQNASSSASSTADSTESTSLLTEQLTVGIRKIPRPKFSRNKSATKATSDNEVSENRTGVPKYFSLPLPNKKTGGHRKIPIFKERIYDVPNGLIPKSHRMMMELLKTNHPQHFQLESSPSKPRRHDFAVKEFDHLVACQVCYQLIFGRALACEGCPLLCHMKCELRVVTPCNGSVSSGALKQSAMENQLLKGPVRNQANGLGTYQSTGTSSSGRSTGSGKGIAAFFTGHVKKMGSIRNGVGMKETGAEIDVMFITERMLVLTFPDGGFESAYRNSLKEVSRMLKTKHGDRYKIFNLSKRRHDLCKLNANVAEFGWPEDLAPPLERLCAICKEVENWLSADPQNVIVVHAKGGKSRPAVVIAAYLHYTNICANEDQALDRFAMRRFTDDYVGGIAQPSHRRYVMYFSGLLSGAIKINSSAIYLQHIAVLGLPMIDGKVCNPFLKIYEKMVPVHTSGVYSPDSDQLSIRFRSPLALRGDVLVKCFHKKGNLPTPGSRQIVFRCQFNTCALDFRDANGANRLTFTKDDLDEACKDSLMPQYSRVEMLFSLNPHHVPMEANLVPSTPEVEPELPRWDSYENFASTPEDEDYDLSTSETDQIKKSSAGEVAATARNERTILSEEKSGLYSSIQKGLKDSKSHLAAKNQMGTTGPFPVTSSSSQSSPPLPNESTDSGISTASGGKPTTNLVNGEHSPLSSEGMEQPIVKVQHKRPNLDAAKDQFAKVFGLDQSASTSKIDAPKVERTIRAKDGPAEVVMEASVKSNSTELRAPPPPPPPKPPNGRQSRSESDYAANRPHAVLPNAKRPLSPGIAMSDGTPSMIDVELVGKDRYDPQSKAFSYVPSNVLEAHFKSPKKQTRWVAEFEGPDGLYRESDTGATSEMEDWRPEETPKKPPPLQLKTEELDEVEMPKVETPRGKARKTKYNMYRTLDDYSSDMDDFCDPEFYLSYTSGTVVPGTPTKPSESFNSSTRVRTPASDANSLIFEQVPPPIPPAPIDYKLESNSSSASIPGPRKPARPEGSSKTVERQSLDTSVRDLEIFEESLLSNPVKEDYPATMPGPSRRLFGALGPPAGRPKMASSWDPIDDAWGSSLPYVPSGSRSVASTPVHHTPRNDPRRDDRFSFSSDMDPDEWLENQLEKLRLKKIENDPDIKLRREHERQLLDELKHIHEDRMVQRGRTEADYSVEGVGSKTTDPVEEWKREEDRLRNAKSPLLNRSSYSTPSSPFPKRALGPSHESSTTDKQLLTRQNSDLSYDRGRHPFVAGKPPTPPPRERSRTPPSPRRQSPIRTGPLPTYDQAVARGKGKETPPPEVPPLPSGYGVRNGGGANFDHLESLLWDADAPLRPGTAQEKPDPNSRQGGNMNLVSQSPKSILKKPRPGDSRTEQPPSVLNSGSVSAMSNGPVKTSGPPVSTPLPVQRSFDSADSGVTKPQAVERATGYTEVDIHANRSETPAFPVRRIETPLPYHPLLYEGAGHDPRSPGQPRTPLAQQNQSGRATAPITQTRSPSPGSMYYAHSRRSSWTSLGEPMEVIHHHPVFVKDTSKYWYKPTISREDAINILKEKQPGTFIVRDSNSFPGAFGLALKVATPPPGVQAKSGDGTELVRHFLIEPSAKGVKLKGCNNEPVFGSLSALVYQHSITPLALPCKLILPEFDPAVNPEQVNSAQALLEQGAACNVVYVYSCDTESLTGPEAVRRVIDQAFSLLGKRQLTPTSVHFKVSSQGITVTDNTRKLFFRRHYPTNSVTFCGLDPEDRRWNHQAYDTAGTLSGVVGQARIFGFVARKISSRTDNACHIFAELEAEQPATAIVNFVTKVMMAPLQQPQIGK